ncbi:MAG: C10 family peptidase [Bacteroidales bacterium]|nr:C10 family peptidase [Bacteroidales bacterium]
MKKIYIWSILTLIIATFLPSTLIAQENTSAYDVRNAVAQRETHVTPAQALDVGYTFMHMGTGTRGGGTRSSDVRKQAMQLVYTGQATDSLTGTITDCYYVFALQPKGFVIVAADDRVEPILGYSYDNNFVVANMPAHVRGWLGNYEKQIEAVAKSILQPEPATQTKWTRLKSGQPINTRNGVTVGPLLITTWNQAPYYNNLCPMDANGPGGHALAGCVATAMAQIINYWGYPVHGRGTHSYSSNYGTLTVNYDSAHYDYTNMPTALTATSTADEVNAVATLIRDCGVAVNMQYNSSESGSFDMDARAALINFFRFSPNISYVAKDNFSNSAWHSLLRENLDANSPILYSGLGSGGHSFVCDGYNDNYFHFNFGWSGNNDGWYFTSSITPGNYDYNSSQTALIGIVPDSTGNIILGQMAGNSTFMVDEPLDFYHLLGHNAYTGTNYNNYCNNTIVFAAADSTKQLVLDVLSFENQNVSVYDSIMGNQLAAFLPNAINNPVTSTSHALTLVYQGNVIYTGFQLNISQNNGCRMVSNLSWSVDTTTIHLDWHENGNATQWQVEYGLKGFSHGSGTFITVQDTMTDICGLHSFREYDMYIRPICSMNEYGPWRKVTVMPEARYWTDVVTSQPEGYVEDSLGNVTISSVEGLAWMAKLSQSYEWGCFLQDRYVVLTSDINLGQYKWKSIINFSGVFDGQGHRIDSMYTIEENNASSLFSVSYYTMYCPHYQTLKNIFLTNCYSKRKNGPATGLTERADTIMNCFVSGRIEGGAQTAAFSVSGGKLVINCASNCCIIGNGIDASGIFAVGTGGKTRNCYSASIFTGSANRKSSISSYCSGVVENCYGHLNRNGNIPFANATQSSTLALYDNTWFDESDSGFFLIQPVFFEPDNQYHSNLTEALNAGVRKYNLPGLRIWVDDTVGINEGMPILGPEYLVRCPNIQNLNARNILGNNSEYGVELSWSEMSDATSWEIEYHAADSANIVRKTTTNMPDTILGLVENSIYIFRVRPICSSSNFGGWSEEYSHIFKRPYWTDIVTSQPESYSVDADGNVIISSAEGLAWLASVVNGLNGQTANNLEGKTVSLTHNVSIGLYSWKAINGFLGSFDGKNNTISGLYINESHDSQGLFGEVEGGNFANIYISNAYVRGNSYCGLLLGMAKNSTVTNCHSSGTVVGDNAVGGLVGWNSGYLSTSGLTDGIIVNACSSSGVVQSKTEAAGLCGAAGTIMNSFSSCRVIANNFFGVAGGLCLSVDSVWNSYSIGDVNGIVYVGGLARSARVVSNCYAGGTVTASVTSLCMDSGYGLICGPRSGSLMGTPLNSIISNSYGLADYSRHPMIGVSDYNYGYHAYDTASFSIVGDSITLLDSVAVGQNHYRNLLDALNAWVDTYDTAGIFLHWVADTAGVNGGFPMFEKIRSYNVILSVADSTLYGKVSGAGVYTHVSPAIISATPDYGYHFVQWSDGSTDNPRTIRLTQDTNFTAIFGKNAYSIVGNGSTGTNHVLFDFEDMSRDSLWTLLDDGNMNRWHIGRLGDTSRYLYISYDNGASNSYTYSGNDVIVTYTSPFMLAAGPCNYSFDCHSGIYDYFNAYLIPITFSISTDVWQLPNDVLFLGQSFNNLNWTRQSGQKIISASGLYYLCFRWVKNPSGVGSDQASAIDNIQIYNTVLPEYCSRGYVLGSDTVPYLDTVTLTAVPYEGYRFLGWHDGNTDNPRSVVATADMSYVATFECIPYNVSDSIVACGSYTWHDSIYTTSTLLVESFTSQAGCDSIVTHHLTIYPLASENVNVSICENDLPYTFHFGDRDTIFEVGTPPFSTLNFKLSTIHGCDSIITLNLTINHGTHNVETETACESFMWHGVTYTTSGVYTYEYTNATGCASVDTLYLIVNHGTHNVEIETACESFTWHVVEFFTWISIGFPIWHDIELSTSGTYTYEYTNAVGCASVDTLHLTVNYGTHNVETETACESFTWHGQTYTSSGTYTHAYTNATGCASVDTLKLIVNHGTHNVETETACESFTWHGQTYTSSGTYTHAYTNTDGCASVDTLKLTVNYGTHNVETETACESFTWHGQTYTTSGTYTHAYTNTNGCASMDTLKLTVNYGTHNVETETACESFTWHGQTYTSSGTYTYAYTNTDGCASVDTLKLTVNHGTHNVETEAACESFTWRGHTYTSSGTFTYAYTNTNGCASVDTLHLTVNYGTHNVETETACESFTWHGQTYTSSGTYTHVYTNAIGCASVDTLKLTVNHGTHNVETETACESFTWHGQTYTSSGTYTHAYTNTNGCASVDTLYLTVSYGTHNVETEIACESFTWHGQTYTSSGTYTHAYTNAAGCASVDTLKLTVNHGTHNVETETACESFTWHGMTYTTSGTYTHVYTNTNGCASMDTLKLTVNPTRDAEFTISCPDSCYVWNDQTYCASGDYTQTLQTVHGCDSVVTLHLTITVGIDDHNTFDFKVYPNPTNGIVNVQFTNHNSPITQIQVFDIYGKLVGVVETLRATSLQTGTSAQTQIDLSRYANGVYFIKVVADGNVIGVKKVVKQ